MSATLASTLVTCRRCGRQGYETDDDPCPGICPLCMDGMLERIRRRLEAYVAGEAATLEQGLTFLASQLRRSGFTEAAVTEQLAGVVEGLALETE